MEQRILDEGAQLSRGAVTGWAALRWRGAFYLDGGWGGGQPIELAVAEPDCTLRERPGRRLNRRFIPPREFELVAGLPVATPHRAIFDEIHTRGTVGGAVEVIDMAAAAELTSAWLFADFAGKCNGKTSAPLARRAASLAVDESLSPPETRLRLTWTLGAGLPAPLVNHPVYDRQGRFLGIPDLLDPVSGLAGEYDGAYHRDPDQHRDDVRRLAGMRDHGLEVVSIVAGQRRDEVISLLLAGARRASRRPVEDRRWTIERPPWDPEPEHLTARLERRSVHL